MSKAKTPGAFQLRQRTSSSENYSSNVMVPHQTSEDYELNNLLMTDKDERAELVDKVQSKSVENGNINNSSRSDEIILNAVSDTQILLPHGDRTDSKYEIGTEVKVKLSNETSWRICLQVSLPFLVAGFGTVAAGLVLDIVQHWKVFEEVKEIFILVPALLGLKGNLEMTLASRLSTAANIGKMDSSKEQWKMIGGNMALVQCQATVVGFLASLAAVLLGLIPDGKLNIDHALLLCASSLVTATLASAILGFIMVLVILVSKKCKINPDNVATPIAASLGDLTTLSLLTGISNVLYYAIGKQHWLAPFLIVIFLGLAPFWAYIAYKNHYTEKVLYSGWSPVILAMVISSAGGLVLDFALSNDYQGVAVFTPTINGVGGNLVAVQASRISTCLHSQGEPGCEVQGLTPSICYGYLPSPIKSFFGKSHHARTARVLFLMVVPGHLVFLITITFLQAGHTSSTPRFVFAYLTVAMIQVALLLYMADWMVHLIWARGADPDNFSIPYLTAIGDVLGTGLLSLAFHILWKIGDKDSDVGD